MLRQRSQQYMALDLRSFPSRPTRLGIDITEHVNILIQRLILAIPAPGESLKIALLTRCHCQSCWSLEDNPDVSQ